MSQAQVPALDECTSQRTHADTRDFLRGVTVIEYRGAQAEQLLRDVFQDHQAQQDAFAVLAAGELTLVPLLH